MVKIKEALNPNVLEQLYWNNKKSLSGIAKTYNIDPTSVLKRMKKYGIPRRSLSESGFVFYNSKPKFIIKYVLTAEEELLKVAGLMLYWSEGSFKGNTIDFANSNPDAVRLFLKFLRNICGVSEERLRVYLYAFSNQDIQRLKQFWSNVTAIPIKQFIKPYIRSTTTAKHNVMTYGLVKIRYSDKILMELLRKWLYAYINDTIKQSGQVAERSMAADCVETQRSIEK